MKCLWAVYPARDKKQFSPQGQNTKLALFTEIIFLLEPLEVYSVHCKGCVIHSLRARTQNA